MVTCILFRVGWLYFKPVLKVLFYYLGCCLVTCMLLGVGTTLCIHEYVLYSGLAMLDGYMYAVGGWDGSMRLDTVEQYNLYTNAWCLVSNMKMALTSPAVAAVDGCLFVTGL